MDVLALGELLIDFSVVPSVEGTTSTLLGSAGGAPANVLAALCKLGGSGQMIAKVGNDAFGDFLTSCIKRAQIQTDSILRHAERTTLAFVQLDEHGERSFSFERDPGADTLLEKDDLDASWFEDARLFHFGSLSLTNNPAREATYAAVELARSHGCVVSFDPNLREPLWDDLSEAKEQMLRGASFADIVKVSGEELLFLTNATDVDTGVRVYRDLYPKACLIVTLGSAGACFDIGTGLNFVSTIDVQAIDTTAAGDAFFGAFLYRLTRSTMDLRTSLSNGALLRDAIRFANVAGALTTTKRGAFDAMPSLQDISSYINP